MNKILLIIVIVLAALLTASIMVSIIIVMDKQLKLSEYHDMKESIYMYKVKVRLRDTYLRQIKIAKGFKNYNKIDIILDTYETTKDVEKEFSMILAGRDVTGDL